MSCYQHAQPLGNMPSALVAGVKTGATTFAVAFVLLALLTFGAKQ